MKKLKFTVADILCIGLIFMIGLTGSVLIGMQYKDFGRRVAVIRHDSEVLGEYTLSEDSEKTLTFTLGNEDKIEVDIHGYEVAVTHSTCKDQICVKTGAIHRTNEMIVCLPLKVVVEIVGGEETDYDVKVY